MPNSEDMVKMADKKIGKPETALLLKFLNRYWKHHPTILEMTDEELAFALVQEIWGDMTLGDRDEALLFEAISRICPGDL